MLTIDVTSYNQVRRANSDEDRWSPMPLLNVHDVQHCVPLYLSRSYITTSVQSTNEICMYEIIATVYISNNIWHLAVSVMMQKSVLLASPTIWY